MNSDTEQPLKTGDPCWVWNGFLTTPCACEFKEGMKDAFPWDKKAECQKFIDYQRQLMSPRYTGD